MHLEKYKNFFNFFFWGIKKLWYIYTMERSLLLIYLTGFLVDGQISLCDTSGG